MAAKRKATTKATTAKRATKTIAVKRKPVAKAAPAKRLPAVKDAFSKSQLQTEISEATELSKKQVASVLEELAGILERHVKARAVGEFTLPGLMKVRVVRKPATKARKGINPFTGEETVFKAKPARNVVKIKPLKKLKDMVA